MNTGYMFTPEESPVTFSDTLVSQLYPNFTSGLIYSQDVDSAPIHKDDNITVVEPVPLSPYTFNPDIYHDSMLSLPRNIMRTIPQARSKKAQDISAQYHMPHWKYSEFTPSQQQEFIARYFPDRMGLYKKYTHEQERTHLFIYLWMYMNGGVYIGPAYEVLKALDSILEDAPPADLYFTLDSERYISSEFFASQPFCEFWLELVDLMEKRIKYKYPLVRDEIDRNTGRGLLTDVSEETFHKFEIIPRTQLDPYGTCDTEYNKDSYLCPSNRDRDFMTYVSCQTGSSAEVLYATGIVILILSLMFIIALITN